MAPKKKTEKMSLGTFLQDENYGSWADEMEDMPLPTSSYGTERRGFGSSNTGFGGASRDPALGGGSSFADRGYSTREQLPLPSGPPYTVHLANLSFDANDDDVNQFFHECQVKEVRIVKDRMDDKPKGFGYVTFETLEGLKTALNISGGTLAGRPVRISVAEPPKSGMGSDPSRDLSDWSRKGPLPDLPGQQRRVSDRPAFNRFDDNRSDAGSDRGGRRGYEPAAGDGKVRDFSNWERKGPLPGPPQGTSLREGGRQPSKNGPDFRRGSPSWGEGRPDQGSQDGSRPPARREYEKPAIERQPTAPELDNEWRSKMRPDPPAKSPTPETSAPPSPRPGAGPGGRPKLNLQKRTVSEADPAASPSATTDSKASPFGAARPVDTATKERAIEEKRQQQLRERKEAEDKAKAEKAEEKRVAKEKTETEKPESPKITKQTSRSEVDEEEKSEKAANPKFDILRRESANDMIAEDEQEEIPGPDADRDVKPKEIVVPTPQANGGAWRKNGPKSPEASTTAETMEEDGWSTVSKPNKQRNNRRGAPRALAS